MESENLVIGIESKNYLHETAKWAKLLAIAGFIMTGLLVLIAFGVGAFMNNFSKLGGAQTGPFSSIIITIFYLAIAAIYIFPCLYLYRFAIKTKLALAENDTNQLTEALMNQKSLYKFMGVATIIMLVFYALAIVFVLIGFLMGGFMK